MVSASRHPATCIPRSLRSRPFRRGRKGLIYPLSLLRNKGAKGGSSTCPIAQLTPSKTMTPRPSAPRARSSYASLISSRPYLRNAKPPISSFPDW